MYSEIYPATELNIEDYDSFAHFYRTDEFSVISKSYAFEISHSVRYILFRFNLYKTVLGFYF